MYWAILYNVLNIASFSPSLWFLLHQPQEVKKVKKIRKKFSDLEKNAFFDLIVGNKEKNEENNEVSSLNRESSLFTSNFSDWSPLNRKSRFFEIGNI